jgi:hypothetical protein
LQNFSLASGHFKFLSPSYPVGTLPYVLSITRKEMKINFLQVLDIRMPSGQGVTPKTTHWPKPRQAYFRENASLGWQYPTLTCDIIVIRKVRKRRYWNTPCFTIHRAHPPMQWPHMARAWDQAKYLYLV